MLNLVSEESIFSQLFPFVHTVVWHALKIHWNSCGVVELTGLSFVVSKRTVALYTRRTELSTVKKRLHSNPSIWQEAGL